MTIAICAKVNDGIVLGSDSASTLSATTPDGTTVGVAGVFNNADKVFNLHRGLPIGVVMWGSGNIGPASMATVAKDFRVEISSASQNTLDPNNYSVKEVAERFGRYIAERWKEVKDGEDKGPNLGMVVAGYGSNESLAEDWQVIIRNGKVGSVTLQRPREHAGMSWHGVPEPITRLIMGFSNDLPTLLKSIKIPDDQVEKIIRACKENLQAQMLHPAMPIKDLIDLVEFLVDCAIQWVRFLPGAPTVGGPIEVAAITKHEGFRWIKRKHWFHQSLNPAGGGSYVRP